MEDFDFIKKGEEEKKRFSAEEVEDLKASIRKTTCFIIKNRFQRKLNKGKGKELNIDISQYEY